MANWLDDAPPHLDLNRFGKVVKIKFGFFKKARHNNGITREQIPSLTIDNTSMRN